MTPEQFQTIFRDYLSPISKYLARRVEPESIEDLASDIFAIAWQKRDYIPSGSELAWLYKTARFVVSNHRRKKQVATRFLSTLLPPAAAPSAENLALAEMGLANSWAALNEKERELLSLSVYEGLTSKEIAKVLDTTENSVNIRLSRVKQKFLQVLKENQ
jgi:RNA polymerase sigma-70 factor (ECF subfamily)